MEEKLLERLCLMIGSQDREMRDMAVVIFCDSTQDYENYYRLRTMYNSKSIELPEPQRGLFNKLFNHLDKDTINPFLDREKKKYKGGKMGRLKVIQRSCILSTKEQQKKEKNGK